MNKDTELETPTLKTTPKHLEIFKHEVMEWIDILELNNWKCYFRRVEIDNYSDVITDSSSGIACFSLAESWDEFRPLNEAEIMLCAKHEAIHLLLSKLCHAASTRFTSEDRIDEYEHEIVRKLDAVL